MITISFLIVLAANDRCNACDPYQTHGWFSALECEQGGYAEHLKCLMNEQKSELKKLGEQEQISITLTEERNYLKKRERELMELSNKLDRIESGIHQEISKISGIRSQLISFINSDIARLNEKLKKHPTDQRLRNKKSTLEKLLNTVLDIVIPSSPIDFIPLKKPWKALKLAIDAYFAITKNWFDD